MGTQSLFMDEKSEYSQEGGSKAASRAELRALIEKQGYRCAMSGVALEPDTANLDHIVPVTEGGGHDIGNLQVLHRDVNRMKGQLSNEEFVRWCCLIAHNHAKTHSATPLGDLVPPWL